MKKRFILGVLLGLFSFVSNVHAERVDGILAKVGSEVITISDVAQAVSQQRAFLMRKFGKQKGTEEFLKFKKNVLQEMILDRILKAQIRSEGIVVTSEELGQEYDARLRQYGISEPGLVNQLMREGVSLKDYKESIKTELARQKFIQKKIMPTISISDYDLQQEYKKNISKFQVYSKVDFIEVFLTMEKFQDQDQLVKMAKQIQSQLKGGATPTGLIKRYSSGAYAGKGGLSGMVESNDLRPEIQKLLSTLNPGQTSDIIPIQHGVFIFKLLKKAEPTPVPFNKVSNQLRQIYGQKVVNDELKRYLMAVKDQTYVEVLR